MKARTTRFDTAGYLDSEERQVAYIKLALEAGDIDFIQDAYGIVARAREIRAANKANLNRENRK